jgi:hypothetical protein
VLDSEDVLLSRLLEMVEEPDERLVLDSLVAGRLAMKMTTNEDRSRTTKTAAARMAFETKAGPIGGDFPYSAILALWK